MENFENVLEIVILNLPNFAGLIIALAVVSRSNVRLTEALIDMAKRCVEEVAEASERQP